MIPNYWSPGRGKLNIGNYYCQDFLNNPNCNFDGGDCCGANVNTDLCHECFCYGGCDTFFYPYWIDDGSEFGATIFFSGDGYCVDESNTEGCLFDRGDCCGPNVDTQVCTECICY